MTNHATTPDVFVVSASGGGGLSRKEARSPFFYRPSRGVRVRREGPDTADLQARAAVAAGRDDAVLTDLSAAHHWGLPLPPWIGLEITNRPTAVAVPARLSQPRRAGVKGRRLLLPEEHLTIHEGVPVTVPARTWLDCAPLVPFEYLVAMGDALLHGQLTTRESLARIAHWAYRRRGVLNARRAIPLLDGAAESAGESLTRYQLVLGGIRPPVCNMNIFSRGQWLARADMTWESERVIVEYDGAIHISEEERRHDAARRNRLQAAGWLVIVVTAQDLQRPEAMCALVSSALRARAPR